MLGAIPDDPRDALRSVTPAAAATARDVRYLVPPDRKKNLLVRYAADGAEFVLKIYRDSPGHLRQTLANPVLSHVIGAYCLRVTGERRVATELASLEGFRDAGIATVPLVGRPAPHALLFRYVDATPLPTILETAQRPAARSWVRRVAADLALRQERALGSRDRRLLHPHPRLTHVLVDGAGTLIHHDFEGVVNPALPFESALGLEVECFLSYLAAAPATRDRAFLDAALDGLGDAPIRRWRSLRRKPLWFLSGSARNRVRRLGWLGADTAPALAATHAG